MGLLLQPSRLMYLVNQPSSCSQRLWAGTTLWRDAVPGTEDKVISLPRQRRHNAGGASHPFSHHQGFRLGGGSGLHAPGFVCKPNPVLEETQSHMLEPGAGLGFPSRNLRPQQELR